MREKAEYGCSLWIDTENEHPNIITELTGIKATDIEVKGEFKILPKGGKILFKRNFWGLKPSKHFVQDEYKLPNCINEIIDILDTHENEFRAVFSRFKIYKLMIYCEVYTRWIQFRAEPEILSRMAKYNVAIDFSIWSFESECKNENNSSD